MTIKLKGMEIQDPDLVSMIMRQSTQSTQLKEKKVFTKISENKENVPSIQMNFKSSMWSKLNPLELANTAEDQSEVDAQ